MRGLAVLLSALLPCVAGVGQAQQGHVAGPIAGYVFDGSARAIRPLLGVPGASIVAGALQLGYDLASGTISPGTDSAVATAVDGALHFISLSGGTANEIPFNAASVKPDRVIFSPSGTAVALIASGHVQVFSGLPASPTLAGTMDLGEAKAAPFRLEAGKRVATSDSYSMALSDDGAWLLVVAAGSVELIGAGGSHALAHAGPGALVTFAPGSHDAAFADRAAQTVMLVRDAANAGAPQPVWQDASIAGSVGLTFSADGKSLFLAHGAGPVVTVLDLVAGTDSGVSCDCTATGLERMGAVYRLNQLGSGPLWLLDPAAGHPRTVFVPAPGSSE